MKKQVFLYYILFFVMLEAGNAFIFYKYGGKILYKINNIISSRKAEEDFIYRHEMKVNVSQMTALIDEPDAWYTRYHIIAHSGGGIDGMCYSNSLEAWNKSYNDGVRIFDADLNITTDGVYVLRHEWTDNLETQSITMNKSKIILDKNGSLRYQIDGMPIRYEHFQKKKIYNRYTPMSLDDMLDYMDAHTDLYVAIDTKADVENSYREIVKHAKEKKTSVLDRIIVSCYHFDDYNKITSIYPFKNVSIRQHYWSSNNYSELVDFCLKNQIHVVNLSSCLFEEPGVRLLIEKNIHIYVAVCDYLSDYDYFTRNGATGVVSNFLTEEN